jgi:hypothetical protein
MPRQAEVVGQVALDRPPNFPHCQALDHGYAIHHLRGRLPMPGTGQSSDETVVRIYGHCALSDHLPVVAIYRSHT